MTDMARLCRSTPRWSSATGPGRAELSRSGRRARWLPQFPLLAPL